MKPEQKAYAQTMQEYYDGMVEVRRKIVAPLVGITLFLFFLQQVLTNFTSALDGLAFEGMTWAYLYGFALFFVVVVLTTIYRSKMTRAERRLRPPEWEETAARYEDPQQWEEHEAELEIEDEVAHELEHGKPATDLRARSTQENHEGHSGSAKTKEDGK